MLSRSYFGFVEVALFLLNEAATPPPTAAPTTNIATAQQIIQKIDLRSPHILAFRDGFATSIMPDFSFGEP